MFKPAKTRSPPRERKHRQLDNIFASFFSLATQRTKTNVAFPMALGEMYRWIVDEDFAPFSFGGEVAAIESAVSTNGKFRILIKEDTADRPWPRQLMMGTGAQGIALLKDVPIWYELWRNINGFPPDYYRPQEEGKKSTAEKK